METAHVKRTVFIELADQQRDQAEERAKKIKAVLVRTKKELSDAKKEADEQKHREAELKVQLEVLTQGNEEGKVGQDSEYLVMLLA